MDKINTDGLNIDSKNIADNVNKAIEDFTENKIEISETLTTVNNSIGNLIDLQTTNKLNITDALNEISQDIDNGKELIVNAINDNSITKDSSFEDICNVIENKNNLIENKNEEINSINTELTNGKQLLAAAIENENITENSSFEDIAEALSGMSSGGGEYRDSLATVMKNKGYGITGEEGIDELLNILNFYEIKTQEVKKICGGINFCALLKTDGSLYIAGGHNNDSSPTKLGRGYTFKHLVFWPVAENVNYDVKDVSCGAGFYMVLKNDGTLWGCGKNSYGQLGLGNTYSYDTLTKITDNVKYVDCGHYHAAIVKNDGSVWSVGCNEEGQLGNGNTTDSSTFVKIMSSGGAMTACGYEHTTVVKTDGSVWSAGKGSSGQLGLDTISSYTSITKTNSVFNVNEIKKISAYYNETFILKTDGTLWSTGSNSHGQFGEGDRTTHWVYTKINVTGVVDVAHGECFTVILKNDGYMYSAGRNYNGQLGLGTLHSDLNQYSANNTFKKVTTVSNVKLIGCGGDFTLAYTGNRTLHACGSNYRGALGDGKGGGIAYDQNANFTLVPSL